MFTAFAREEIAQSIPARFEKIVRQFPDYMALQTDHHTYTYAEINSAANRVARAILARHEAAQTPVILLLEHGAPAITAILGALKAGKIYVPLDPSLPPERTQSIVKDAGTRLLVTNRQNYGFADTLTNHGVQVLDIDTLDPHSPADNVGLSLAPETSACIMYTSGSTGEPKGVLQNHQGILHRVMVHTNLLHICPQDRLTLLRWC
jgi:non-ribosomal peptide synthetase component F